MSNTLGERYRVQVFGQSHSPMIGAVIEGIPAGVVPDMDFISAFMARRAPGGALSTARKEADAPQIVSGLNDRGATCGAPLCAVIPNTNTRSGDYKNLITHPRPSHADWVAQKKWNGYNDPRGGGHFSGRITLGLVAAGVVAKKILGQSVIFSTEITEIGGERDKSKFTEVIEQARMVQDSVGGIVECRVKGAEVGLGEPFFDSTESLMAHLLFSVPAVKGVEFGDGFEVARRRGSQNNDCIADAEGTTSTNHAGGIVGGITNGNEIVVRVAVKPTPSISCEQSTYNFELGRVEPLVIKGRHDVCITLRAAVVVEAAMAIALADLKLRA